MQTKHIKMLGTRSCLHLDIIRKLAHCVQKVADPCTISLHGIIGPYFLKMNRDISHCPANRYVEMLQSFVSPELNNFRHVQETWFQQDGATSRTARQILEAVQELFGNRVISRFGNIYWSSSSPDLSVCDFSLWVYVKSKVYTAPPRTLDELKQKI